MTYILGAGAMARETLDIYRDLGRQKEVRGFIAQGLKKEFTIHGKKVADASLIDGLSEKPVFIGAIGSPLRKMWIENIEREGFGFDTAVHPSVIPGSRVEVSGGSIISKGSILTCDIKIGRHTIINIGCTINHDCVIGEFVTIGPGVNIAGGATVGDGSWIGIGATIIDKVSIGKGSFIGAGAVVTKNIPAGVLALGVPAKAVRKLAPADWEKLV